MHNHTGCICLIFLHCAFSNVSSNGLPERMHSHIGCISLTFLHCVFLNVSSMYVDQRRHNRIGSIVLPFPHCAFSSALQWLHLSVVFPLCVSKCLLKFLGSEMQNHIVRICENVLYCVYSDVPSNVMHVKPNGIRIRIRSFLESRIIFVFVFGHFWETE